MTREEKESLLREAVDILIKLDNHLMTSRDNAEFSQWVEDLIDNYCEEQEPKTGQLTNSEWVDFLSEQFDISRTSAKEMLHAMMSVKREDNFKKQFSGRK